MNATFQVPILFDIRAGYFTTELEGSATLNDDWQFGGLQPDAAGESVATTVTMNDVNVDVAFRLPIPGEVFPWLLLQVATALQPK